MNAARLIVGLCVIATLLNSRASGQDWDESDKLFALDASVGALFGHAICASGDRAVFGAYRENSARGAVYVFVRTEGRWVQEAKLIAQDAAPDDYLGWAVALGGDLGDNLAVAGAYGDDDFGSQSGSAYVFERVDNTWAQVAKLNAEDAEVIDGFGISAFVLGRTAFVGAPFDDAGALDSGSVYVFEEVGGAWRQVAHLVPADPGEQDRFGISVAASGEYVVVGAYLDDDRGMDAGSAYLFMRRPGGWEQVAKLLASDGRARDEFGYSVTLQDPIALIGARYHDESTADTGAVYAFELIDGAWSESAKLVADDADFGARLGASVALRGDLALLGADHDGDRGTGAGAAYLFTISDTGWSQTAKLIGHDTASGDELGHAVALGPASALVGARQDDDWGMDSGSVFVFEPPIACSGRERLSRADCRQSHGGDLLAVKLTRGAAGDTFTVTLETGERVSGALDADGKGKARFRGLPAGEGVAFAAWGCGAQDEHRYACP